MAYALTEPDAGSDTAALRTRAVERDGAWVVDGAKQWITNGGFASVFVVFARTGGAGAGGVSAFVAEPGPGLTVGKEMPKMGLHTSSTVELAFDGLRLEPDRMLGARARGSSWRWPRWTAGASRSPPRRAASPRRPSTWPSTTPASARPSAAPSPGSRGCSSRWPTSPPSSTPRACSPTTRRPSGTPGCPTRPAGAKAKLLASAVAVEAANVAVQTLGGYGYSAEFPAERLYRDAKITELYEGTSQIQRMVIARDLLGDAARD